MAEALDKVLGKLAKEEPAYEVLETYKGKDLKHIRNMSHCLNAQVTM